MKRYTRMFILSMLAYAILLMFAVYYANLNIRDWISIVLNMLPLIPGIFIVISVTGAIMAQDELMQKVQLEALAMAFGGMFLISLSEALLAGVGFGGVPAGARLMLMSGLWMLGLLLARRKYV